MSVKISVITAVYNDEKYIRKCVESIINQTFSCWEYIIVDDGSTDRTPKILQELAQRDQRIQVVTQQNGGPAVARNRAIKAAKGDFIAVQDSDDIAAPDRLERQFNQLIQAGPVTVSCTGYYLIDSNDQVFATHNKVYKDINENLLHGNTSVCHPTMMVPRLLLEKVGGYNPFYAKTEDYDLIIRLLEHNGRFEKLNACLYNYRIRGNSESSMTSVNYINRVYENHINRVNNRPENLTEIVNDYKPDTNYVLKRQLREVFFTENYGGFIKLYVKNIFRLPTSEFLPFVVFSICPSPIQRVLKTLRQRKR